MALTSSSDLSTGDVNTGEDPCGRHSPDWTRPNMSELRIVLLGRSGDIKSKVGNIILGGEVLSVRELGAHLCEEVIVIRFCVFALDRQPLMAILNLF